MSEQPTKIDVSRLPSVTFDHHSLVWWGTMGFILIEGFTLVLMGAAYFYLRINELEWPPGRTPAPDVLIATINTILILLIIIPMRIADKAAHHYNKAKLIPAMLVALAMTLAAIVLRWFEFHDLQVAWDAHAYGSASWGLLVLHSTLLVADFFESGVIISLFIFGRAMKKHYPDVSDACFYQYFLSTVNVPIYFILFWGPRWF
jgi:heme/copper-type cytochrome/quinol oxidase subunit 3